MKRRIFIFAILSAVASAFLIPSRPQAAPGARIPAVSRSPTPPPGFLPDPTSSNGELHEDGVWVFRTGPALIRMSPLTDRGRAAYIQERTGSRIDPFGPKPDGTVRFIVFKLEILNRSDSPIVFEPQKSWLLAKPSEMKLPVDLARIQTGYSVHEREMPKEFNVAGQALLNGERQLPPGVKTSGLLAFTALRNRPREFRIDLEVVDSRGNTYKYRASYTTEKVLKKRMKKLEKQRREGAP